ncbi:Zinc finger protein on ecdysone puffs [Operophtera brumata]|uniref:Zinc finger protein on ecdysone puffs n=1 Tax=Operophtera brumata TaxID=104452 RepID=A0A0L7LRF6_OPEBR|nr:Zinc finger protein on ecdysone puffs [Operophtera brumata]
MLMSSRGRGYGGYGIRGSYSGGRGSYRGSYRGSNRGSYEGRGGRGGYSSYNSDSRYPSSSSNRYSNRDRMDDSYKKPYRSEASGGYSNRDYGGRSGSPERKRMRMEGSSSDRRSHDGGSHYGGSYGSRQEYPSERRSFGGEERRRSPGRDGYRKSSGMGPPREPLRSSMRPRAPRRSFRGRTMRSRTLYRGAVRSRGTFIPRRFPDRALSYSRAFKPIKSRSPIKKDEDASTTEEEWDADDKDELTEDKKELKLTSPKPPSDAEPADGGEETDKEPDAASDAPPRRPRPYVHLFCSYAKHLLSSKHRAAMGSVARRHKAQLLRMRVAQRGAQRELEAKAGAELASRTTFCLVCRLNHRTTRHAHNLTDTHRAMKRFLMPFCRICRLSFRSPMIYEHHISSLDHLKRKANQANRRATSPKAEEASGDEGMDVDLDNFMTLDSVGDVDEVEDDDSGGEKKDEVSPKEPKKEINIGSEHIKKMEVWYCELCRVYLPRVESGGTEETDALRRHCRLRIHLGRYVQHRDTRTLRKHAERIHRQLHQQKGSEDKLWADVDKDIGEFLREVDPQGTEDSADEEDLGRYDKFRKSDKKIKNGDSAENDANAADTTTEKKTTEVNTPA